MVTPDGLQERGAALWDTLAGGADLSGPTAALALEACRVADRLDHLDRILSGDGDVWAYLTHDLRTEDYVLKIDSALSESRQQQMALKQLFAALGVGKLEAAPPKVRSALDDLAARRAERRATASGQ